MKKQLFTAFMLLAITFYGCEKESNNNDDANPICTSGELTISNSSSNPYSIKVNGLYKAIVQGGSVNEFSINVGFHSLKAEQVSGYVLYPTIVESTVTIEGCEKYAWQIP